MKCLPDVSPLVAIRQVSAVPVEEGVDTAKDKKVDGEHIKAIIVICCLLRSCHDEAHWTRNDDLSVPI